MLQDRMETTSQGQDDFQLEEAAVRQKRPQRLTLYAALSIILASLSGLWQFGYSIGTVNAASVPLKKAIKEYYEERYDQMLAPNVQNAVWVVLSAAFPIGGIVGATLVNQIVRKFGRLRGLIYGHVSTIIMSALLGLSGPAKSPEMIALGRIGVGISTSAIGTGITVMYIAELSPRHLRGHFGIMVPVGITLGVTLANVFGLPQVFGSDQLWPLLLSLTCLPSVLFVSLAKVLPESPRELFIEKKNTEAAANTIRKLRGVSDVSSEMEELEKEAERSLWTKQITLWKLIRSVNLRRQTMCAVILASTYQLSGINSIAFNTSDILKKAGVSSTAAPLCTIGVWTGLLLFVIAMSFRTEKLGRRKSLMIGYSILCCSLALLTASIEAQHLSPALAYVSVVAIMGFLIGFGTGPAVTFITVAECFDQAARPAAITLASLTFWICFTIVVMATPYLMAVIGGYLFLIQSAISLAMATWTYFFLPETKNRPFIEIQNSFHKQKYGPGTEVPTRAQYTAQLPL